MNFFMNAGSVPLIIAILVVNFAFMYGVSRVAIRYYRSKWCRKVGMRAEEDLNFKGNILKIYYEGYAEMFLASGMTCIAIMGTVDGPNFFVWFSTFDDFLNSSTAMISMFICMAIPIVVYYLGKKIKMDEYTKEYGFLYENLNVNYKITRAYLLLGLFKRSTCCFILFVLDGQALIQLAIFLYFQLLTLVFHVTYRKRLYMSQSDWVVEFFNDFCMYCVILLHIMFLMEPPGFITAEQ
jgi:hypothetical protein